MTTPTPLSSVPDRVLSPTRSAAAEARRQRREQLRDFYGLKGSSGPATSTTTSAAGTPPASALGSPDLNATTFSPLVMPSSPAPGAPGYTPTTPAAAMLTPKDTRDLSSPNFVPAEYYEDLIAKASLPELLATTSTLASGECCNLWGLGCATPSQPELDPWQNTDSRRRPPPVVPAHAGLQPPPPALLGRRHDQPAQHAHAAAAEHRHVAAGAVLGHVAARGQCCAPGYLGPRGPRREHAREGRDGRRAR